MVDFWAGGVDHVEWLVLVDALADEYDGKAVIGKVNVTLHAV